MDENLLLEPYTTLKLSLSHGLIETLEMRQRDIYGYNDKDEVVFTLSTENEITLIHNVESFKDGLNNIINELTTVNHV